MVTRLISVVFDSADPSRLARFWADALGWSVTVNEPDEVAVESGATEQWGDGGTPCLTFVPVDEPKPGKNRLHLDIVSATGRQAAIVDRLLGLGAEHADIGQGEVPWVVLRDVEGNELCVLEPRTDYEGAQGIGAVVLDCVDPERLAAFWSSATSWPVATSGAGYVSLRHPAAPTAAFELIAVTDQKQAKNRLHIDVAPYPGDDLAEEVSRLERIGARRIDIGQGEVTWVVLADPEGNEFCVLSPR